MLRRQVAAGLLSVMALPRDSVAEKRYDPGASDTEIKLGQTMPYSGPVSAAGTGGIACSAYFDTINKRGGINGRKVTLISLDDGYSPPKTVEMTRRLVESDQVLFLYASVGTPTNAAVQKFLNAKKVPQLFVTTGGSRFNNPGEYPWTIPVLPSYFAEGKALARFALETVAEPKIAVLYQNDDLGKDFVGGFKTGLGDRAKSLIVSEQTFEITDPTIDNQVIASKASGADVLYYAGTQKFGAMQIRARYDLGWKPLHLVCTTASGVESVLKPAGLEKCEGLISTAYAKDPFDPAWKDDGDVQAYIDWVKATLPASPSDAGYVSGYISSSLTAHVLRQAGDELTRANILKIATHLDHLPIPLLLPGITMNTSPTNYSLIDKFRIQQFRDGRWHPLGKLVSGG
jgi:ABC-type branched-subunit amino acid transport system substrate-binding protein